MDFFSPLFLYNNYSHPFFNMYGSESNNGSGIAFDGTEILVRFLKYVFEGIIVAVAAYFIPGAKMEPTELLMISLIAAATFAILDLFAPSIGSSVRTGAGFGIGANLVGFPGGGMPR
jgi:hypothetical protein